MFDEKINRNGATDAKEKRAGFKNNRNDATNTKDIQSSTLEKILCFIKV